MKSNSASSIIVTPCNALNELDPVEVHEALLRHLSGDWGDVCRAIEEVSRFLSICESRGKKFWVVTEPDRSITSIVLPEKR